MKEQPLHNRSGVVKPLLTAQEKAQEQISETPLTDEVLRVIHQTAGQKVFPAVCNIRPKIDCEATFIDYVQFEPWSDRDDEFKALYEDLREREPGLDLEIESGAMIKNLFELVTADESSELKDLQRQAEKIAADCEPYSLTKISDRVFAIRDEQARAIHAGEDPGTQLVPSRDAVRQDS